MYSLIEHARTKGMWAGALGPVAIPGLTGLYPGGVGAPPRLLKITREHTPALLKIIDEALVNASDHCIELQAGPATHRVTRIALAFDPASGEVCVENDGAGIPIRLHPGASKTQGRDVYVPEVAFAVFLSGRNLSKPPTCVKGGVNGVGAKLINVHSAALTVETWEGGQHYRQTWRDRLRFQDPPAIAAAGAPKKGQPTTRVRFLPDYAALGYPLAAGGGPAPAAGTEIDAWCRWRAALLAAYVGKAAGVFYNGARCSTTSAQALAEMATAAEPQARIFAFTARAPDGPAAENKWEIAAAVLPGSAPFAAITVINGVHTASGPHLALVKKWITDAVGAQIARATKASKAKGRCVTAAEACQSLLLVIVGAIGGADWSGQRKDVLQVPPARLKGYVAAPVAALNRLAASLAERYLGAAAQAPAPPAQAASAVAKYTPARRAASAAAGSCRLLLAEGDSALSLLRSLLAEGRAGTEGPTSEYYGTFSLGGVIVNARKQTTEQRPQGGGEPILVRSDMLRANKVLRDLETVLGLDYGRRYATAEERARLRYGGVVVCTDQDLDGVGKILPLVLVYFHRFWPSLVAAGYVARLVTPVLRVWPPGRRKAQPLEFFSEAGFAAWGRAEPSAAAGATVKYYKGLGSHDAADLPSMARAFAASVQVLMLDARADEVIETYYGAPSGPRKKALSAGPSAGAAEGSAPGTSVPRELSCSVLLETEARAYKLDDLQRKLPGLDGLPVTRRKILCGALQRFAAANREVRVYQLGGFIAERLFYHHGDASLNATITGMGQRFPGALRYPYLEGVGQFGSRHFGGTDAASPRYISVRLAAPYVRALFPDADTWLLHHVHEDGERAQPRCYVPVLATAVLESFEIPSEGWRHKSVARDLASTVELIRAYVRGDPELLRAVDGGWATCSASERAALRRRFPLPASLSGYGEHLPAEERAELLRTLDGAEHSFGHYVHYSYGAARSSGTKDHLHITELPIGLPTARFLARARSEPLQDLVQDVVDESAGWRVDATITLRSGAYEEICARFGTPEMDPVESCFGLHKDLKPHLNYYSDAGGVLEFGEDYHAVVAWWLPRRRLLYAERLERERVTLQLQILLEEQTVRYIEAALPLAEEPNEAAASALLSAKSYPRLDAALIRRPGFVATGRLAELATGGEGASHKYLLGLQGFDHVLSARRLRERKLDDKKARLVTVLSLLAETPFAGASVWMDEIDRAVEAIELGERNGWRF